MPVVILTLVSAPPRRPGPVDAPWGDVGYLLAKAAGSNRNLFSRQTNKGNTVSIGRQPASMGHSIRPNQLGSLRSSACRGLPVSRAGAVRRRQPIGNSETERQILPHTPASWAAVGFWRNAFARRWAGQNLFPCPGFRRSEVARPAKRGYTSVTQPAIQQWRGAIRSGKTKSGQTHRRIHESQAA